MSHHMPSRVHVSVQKENYIARKFGRYIRQRTFTDRKINTWSIFRQSSNLLLVFISTIQPTNFSESISATPRKKTPGSCQRKRCFAFKIIELVPPCNTPIPPFWKEGCFLHYLPLPKFQEPRVPQWNSIYLLLQSSHSGYMWHSKTLRTGAPCLWTSFLRILAYFITSTSSST